MHNQNFVYNFQIHVINTDDQYPKTILVFQAKMFMKYSSKPLKLETVRNDIIKGTLDVISSLPVYLKGESDRKKNLILNKPFRYCNLESSIIFGRTRIQLIFHNSWPPDVSALDAFNDYTWQSHLAEKVVFAVHLYINLACLFVCLSVCLSVCLFVSNNRQNG